jgi:hypothetical protein
VPRAVFAAILRRIDRFARTARGGGLIRADHRAASAERGMRQRLVKLARRPRADS